MRRQNSRIPYYNIRNELTFHISLAEAHELYEKGKVDFYSKGVGRNYRITAVKEIKQPDQMDNPWRPLPSGPFIVMQLET